MHWKVKIFILLYQNAVIPTTFGAVTDSFFKRGSRGRAADLAGIYCSFPATSPCSLCSLAGAGAVPRAQDPIFSLFLRGSRCWRSCPPVSRTPRGLSAISWLAVPSAEQAGTQRWCSHKQPAGRALATGRAACHGARLWLWDAEEEKQPLSQNAIQITPYITWSLSRAWGRGSFQSPVSPEVVPGGNAWCVEASSLCLSLQTPLKILPLYKNLSY